VLLVLWDVDHTLIESRGVGGRVFRAAFEKATGAAMSAGIAHAPGETEPALFRRTLALNGVADSEGLFEDFAEAQAEEYRARGAELASQGRVLPGVEAALRRLDASHGVVQSVLTGNTRASAAIKLAAFGIERYLDLEIGAYGDDSAVRAELVPVARERAEHRLGVPVEAGHVVLIGDTPRDVAAAHRSGARVIAVATGSPSRAALTASGAGLVLDTVDAERLAAFLGLDAAGS
jgi:phosphoglycolate phosphatase